MFIIGRILNTCRLIQRMNSENIFIVGMNNKLGVGVKNMVLKGSDLVYRKKIEVK